MIDMFNMISNKLRKKTVFVSVPLDFGVFLARIFKVLTLGKIDYIEKVQRMREDRSYPHEDATRDFGYDPMTFVEGHKMEVDEYVKKFK